METALSKECLTGVFDRVMRDIIRQEAGIVFSPAERGPDAGLCTVHILFEKGVHTSLCLYADPALFTHMALCFLPEDCLTPEIVEEVAKEHFNVLCGHIAAQLFQAVKVPSRFSIPAFYPGRYEPEGYTEYIVLSYSSDHNENVQLVCRMPSGEWPRHSEQKEVPDL